MSECPLYVINRVVVMVNERRLSFQLGPVKEADDLIDRPIEHHASFGKLLERRLREH